MTRERKALNKGGRILGPRLQQQECQGRIEMEWGRKKGVLGTIGGQGLGLRGSIEVK